MRYAPRNLSGEPRRNIRDFGWSTFQLRTENSDGSVTEVIVPARCKIRGFDPSPPRQQLRTDERMTESM